MESLFYGLLSILYIVPCRRISDAPGEVTPRSRKGGAHQRSESTVYSKEKLMGSEIEIHITDKTEHTQPIKLQGGHYLKKSIYTSYAYLLRIKDCRTYQYMPANLASKFSASNAACGRH